MPLPAAFLHRLKTILPAASILTNAEATRAYECDALSAYTTLPAAVVLPSSEAEIVAILKLCHEYNVVITPRGAGTGLSGGAQPIADGIVLSTSKMRKIVAINSAARYARLEPGVRNLAITEAAAPYGLYYAPDPSSQIACSIGGNVAENAGGVHCLKYGLTMHNILALRLVLMDGSILPLSLEDEGLDLLAVVIGSEGMLGVVSEITVRLNPAPEVAKVILASFDTMAAAGDAVAALIAAGITPAGLEMMDQRTIALVEPFAQAGYDPNAAAVLLCESDGKASEVEAEIAEMSKVLKAAGATALRISQDDSERQRIWSGRKSAFPAAGRASADYLCMDGTIPRRTLSAVINRITEMEKQYQLRAVNVFHAGDGNLHPLIMFDARNPGELQRAEAFGADILDLCVAVGGTISGEHGIGIEKLGNMCTQFTEAERDTFIAVKTAFDPKRLLNPNKVIPTLSRCAEHKDAANKRAQRPELAEIPIF